MKHTFWRQLSSSNSAEVKKIRQDFVEVLRFSSKKREEDYGIFFRGIYQHKAEIKIF